MGSKPDFQSLIREGAIILDVRTKGEYTFGHIRGSINIPLDQLPKSTQNLDKGKPIITCCASGIRSNSAKRHLKAQGFESYNGGSWKSLKGYV